jgi:hypothetical protein
VEPPRPPTAPYRHHHHYQDHHQLHHHHQHALLSICSLNDQVACTACTDPTETLCTASPKLAPAMWFCEPLLSARLIAATEYSSPALPSSTRHHQLELTAKVLSCTPYPDSSADSMVPAPEIEAHEKQARRAGYCDVANLLSQRRCHYAHASRYTEQYWAAIAAFLDKCNMVLHEWQTLFRMPCSG